MEEYKYSSARFYETGGDGWDFSPITKSNYNCVVGEQHQQWRKSRKRNRILAVPKKSCTEYGKKRHAD